MNSRFRRTIGAGILALAIGSSLGGCSKFKGAIETKDDSAVVLTPYPERVYWGDTHLHTANSPDAFAFGNRLPPEDALRFARGEEVTSSTGQKARLARPLDFLVVTDHAEAMGATRALYEAPRLFITDPTLRRWHDLMHEGPEGSAKATAEMLDARAHGNLPRDISDPKQAEDRIRSTWEDNARAVERYNEPGKFTAFLGFEYTLMKGGNNLHRNVVFRDGWARVSTVLPLDPQSETTPEKLWDYLDAYEKSTGGRALAIPHNSNVSNGLMFMMTEPGGAPMSVAYAKRRLAHEPLVEITQIKGDSEAHSFLSPNDEFAGYGDAGWELSNLMGTEKKTPDMFAAEYVREALKRGLAIEQRTGVNPYKFGLIGSTDSHTSLATGDEDNFWGKHSGVEPNAHRAIEPQNLGTATGRFGWQYLAGGYAGVWANGNTRAAIFDAMARREVYATTGPRMTVRVFGGWDFTGADLQGDWVKAGYSRGVPMGGTLPAAAQGRPSFIVSALKDPIGANLDRVQVVKGWVDKAGNLHEKIFDVVWSSPETRKIAGGRLAPVGDTVNLSNATYANTIGAPSLATVWTDPEFDPGLRCFYYLRVLQIPTLSWPAYDAVRYHLKLPPEVQVKAQERAYTSPIWYTPGA